MATEVVVFKRCDNCKARFDPSEIADADFQENIKVRFGKEEGQADLCGACHDEIRQEFHELIGKYLRPFEKVVKKVTRSHRTRRVKTENSVPSNSVAPAPASRPQGHAGQYPSVCGIDGCKATVKNKRSESQHLRQQHPKVWAKRSNG